MADAIFALEIKPNGRRADRKASYTDAVYITSTKSIIEEFYLTAPPNWNFSTMVANMSVGCWL